MYLCSIFQHFPFCDTILFGYIFTFVLLFPVVYFHGKGCALFCLEIVISTFLAFVLFNNLCCNTFSVTNYITFCFRYSLTNLIAHMKQILIDCMANNLSIITYLMFLGCRNSIQSWHTFFTWFLIKGNIKVN